MGYVATEKKKKKPTHRRNAILHSMLYIIVQYYARAKYFKIDILLCACHTIAEGFFSNRCMDGRKKLMAIHSLFRGKKENFKVNSFLEIFPFL